jgi:hypothetical protein
LNPGRRGGKPATNRLSYGAANEDVNEMVWELFVSVRAKNHRVSGPVVQEYAKKSLKTGED